MRGLPVAAAIDGSNIPAALPDASGRPWPVAPTPARSSAPATTVASTPRTVAPMGESVYPSDGRTVEGGLFVGREQDQDDVRIRQRAVHDVHVKRLT
jgi:hypothetical protein